MRNQGLPTVTDIDVPGPYAFLSLDKQQTSAVNGDAGGSWAPAYPITIGGAGVVFGAPASFSNFVGVLSATGAASLQATAGIVQSGGVVQFEAGSTLNLNASCRLEFQSGSLATWYDLTQFSGSPGGTLSFGTVGTTVNGKIDWNAFSPTIASTAAWSFGSGALLNFGANATWTLTGASTWNGAVIYLGGVERSAALRLIAATSTTAWRYGGATDDGAVDFTHYGGSFDYYTVPALASSRTYVLDSPVSGVQSNSDGIRMTFTCLASGSLPVVTFRRADGTTAASSPTTGPWWITFEWSLSTAAWHAYAWDSGTSRVASQN